MSAARLHGHLRPRGAGGRQAHQGNDQTVHPSGQIST